MAKSVIEPKDGENIIVQFSEKFEFKKNVYISVPKQYSAYVYVDEKPQFSVKPCVKERLIDLADKSFLGKVIQTVFVLKVSPRILWGVGDIQVKNNKLKEAYRVGANGDFTLDITDDKKLINGFKFGADITTDTIKSALINSIQTVARSVLGECFTETDTSVFELSSLTDDLRDKLIERINKEAAFVNLGLQIKTMTLKTFVPQEDLDMIRERINKQEDANEI